VTGALVRGLAVLAIAIAALVIGYLGLHQFLTHQHTPAFGTSWLDTSYYDLQLFLLGSAPLAGPGPFPVALEIARFLAPVTTVLAGVEALRLLLGEQIRRWTAAYAPNHAIVTGDGPMAMELARRLRADKFRTVVLVGAKPETVDQARQLRLLDIAGDPGDLNTLRAAGIARSRVIYACAEGSATNAATALSARAFAKEKDQSLLVHMLVRDVDICTALRARRVGVPGDQRFRLEFFSIEGLAARVLFDRQPQPDGENARVVIVGFGRLGRAMLHEIALRHAAGSQKANVTVVGDQNTPAELSAFADEYPVVSRGCDVTFQPTLLKTETGVTTMITVCSADNDDALRIGLNALPLLVNASDRIVICVNGLSPFGKTFSGDMLDNVQQRLSVFDVLEEACVPDQIAGDLTDQLARAIHRAYLEACRLRGETPEDNPAMLPWPELPDVLKAANFDQAGHIGTKLDAIGCVLIPESGFVPEFAFADGEVEYLAQLEHKRWVKDRAAHGIGYGAVRDEGHHPDMVSWDDLTESAKDKDRDVVRNMPHILRQAGFQILRYTSASAARDS
jgi:Trk K+ transport system NAD-binding subunit